MRFLRSLALLEMRLWKLLLAAVVVAIGVASLPAQDKLGAGTYKGTYTGGAGGGDLHLTLKADGKGGLTGDVGFTVAGEAVVVKMASMKVDGSKLQMVWEFDLQGAKLQSASEGTLSGKTLTGTYKTSADGQVVDEGTWKTTLQ
jgi:hypothetical protein